METSVTGSCHCGRVQFELQGRPKLTVNCHCDDCKKRNGTAFSTYIGAAENSLVITKGEDCIKKYEVENSGEKYFCAQCGSPLYNRNYRLPGMFMLFYGAFSEPEKFPPAFNVYCSSKHSWVDELRNIPSFQATIEK